VLPAELLYPVDFYCAINFAWAEGGGGEGKGKGRLKLKLRDLCRSAIKFDGWKTKCLNDFRVF